MKKKKSILGFEKNDQIELEITGMTAEGSGVGRYREVAVFVPNAAIGDRLRIRVVKTAKTYAFGKIEEILHPSADRIPVDCCQFSQCGGCVFRHIQYGAELRIKEQRVRDAISRIGGIEGVTIRPIRGAPKADHYRNKAQFPVGRAANGTLMLGFYAHHSHRIVACDTCALQPAVFDQAAQAFRQWEREYPQEVYDESTGKGRLRHFYLRQARATGEVMVCVVVNGNGLSGEDRLVQLLRQQVPGVKSIVINSNREKTNVILGEKCRTIWGADTITDILCGLRFRISPLSFYQVNPEQAECLYQLAGKYAGLTGKETLLDLYCGTGTIGLSMAHQVKKLIGVEMVAQAIEDAKKNALENKIQNAEFFCGDAAQAAEMLLEQEKYPDVVVIDPPRKGCDAELIQTIHKMAPQRVVYVSCDPATLARDLKLFSQFNYQAVELTPVDMFPRTAHVECVVLMSRVAK